MWKHCTLTDQMMTIGELGWKKIFICILLTLTFKNTGGAFGDVWKNNDVNSQLTKVLLTQKGYIQFLRYVEAVPPITEYTFCIWMKSNDLTNSHPLLSYSKNDKDRLIRVWISRRGKSLNLELLGLSVFEILMDFREHQWYHVCQSWDSASATWEVFINDKKFRGRSQKLAGLVLPGGGDLVVAQEYTDFDKGLEDGVEGEIFGFNFVLSATTKLQSPKHGRHLPTLARYPGRYRRSFAPSRSRNPPFYPHKTIGNLPTFLWENSYLSSLRGVHHNGMFPQKIPGSRVLTNPSDSLRIKPSNELFQVYPSMNDVFRERRKSTGLMLVELSGNCRIGKGGPLRGKDVLINWTETKMRVFGGAIIKHVEHFC